MKVTIDIKDSEFRGGHKELLEDLLGTTTVQIGREVAIPGDAKLQYVGKHSHRDMLPEPSETLEFILTFSSGVASSMAATWLYDKLRKKDSVLRIEHTVVQLSRESIQKSMEHALNINAS